MKAADSILAFHSSASGAQASSSEPQAPGKEFEAAFLAEMLKHTGLDRAIAFDSGFGGEAMASFFVEEIASLISESGGFGVAELIDAKLEAVK